MKNQRNNNMKNYKNQGLMKIDINSLNRELQHALNDRSRLQAQQDKIWETIRRTHSSRNSELCRVDSLIGKNTYKINGIIGKLCLYKKTHSAMNLAHNYLSREIKRNENIISYNVQLINDVERGRKALVDSYGSVGTNTSDLRNYVRHKREQVERLKKWQNSISRYLV